jgi:glycosyltransferase 2 family protein
VSLPLPEPVPEVGESLLAAPPSIVVKEGRWVRGGAKPLRTLRLFAVYSILAVLLYFALRNAPLVDIWNALNQLKLWQIATLVFINISIYMLISLRWWIIIRAERKTIPYLPLVLVRVAVFGVSYFTLGPQIGGEPLQVLYLQRKYGMTYTRATSTVIMDKLLEFLANFFLLVFGLMAVLQAGIISTNGSKPLMSLIPMAALLAWPPIHIILMIRGIYPIGAGLRAAFARFGNPKWMRFIVAAERMAGMFCQRYPRALWMAVGASLAAGAGMVTEYALITSFLGIDLHGWQTLAAWTTSWLAFLVPLPAGLGALEASQVFTLGAFNISAALAIGVTLLIRARDLLVGGLGLLLASQGVRK